ncbi:hypothetical protein ACHAW5_006678 [Stephanodiscus triporus]|uniref:fumarylacetoacetase n=1 Tax=Stephanodiscus triporus TaxID=2934178 RepID=A0ABD3MEE8_9STRA
MKSSSSSSSSTSSLPSLSSWLDIPPDCDFGLLNVPFGVCSFPPPPSPVLDDAAAPERERVVVVSTIDPSSPRCCTAMGNVVVDLHLLAEAGLLDDLDDDVDDFHPRVVFSMPNLDSFLRCERRTWIAVRDRLIGLFLLHDYDDDDDDDDFRTTTTKIKADDRLRTNHPLRDAALRPMSSAVVRHHVPCTIGDYTDFYSSREHATNVGVMFRGKDDALQPNWLHVPIGYHGRSSSIDVSSSSTTTTTTTAGGVVRRPCGQVMIDPADPKRGSKYGPTRSLDFELEVAFVVGGRTNVERVVGDGGEYHYDTIGRPMNAEEAKDRIFGYVLMNDWSARDVQKWEYVPLGPFTSKNFATTISPWIVTTMALEPYRCATSAAEQGNRDGSGDPVPLEYLSDPDYGSYDVNLSVSLRPSSSSVSTVVCRSNLRHMYWSSVQQLVHHSVTGCPMRAGDLLGSGTISGSERGSFGSMLELSWGGTRDVDLDGGVGRRFLEDGDVVMMEGWCEGGRGPGRVGFGACSARILPAVPFPCDSREGGEERQPPRRYTRFRLRDASPTSTFAWRARIALTAKGVPYETIGPISLEERCRTEGGVCASSITDDAPTRRTTPALEFVDGGNGVVRITQSHAMVDFLESAFPNRGGLLIPPDPVARAKVWEAAEAIDSVVQEIADIVGGAGERAGMTGSSSICPVEDGLSRLEALLAPYHAPQEGTRSAVGGPFTIGTHGPNIADVCLVPLLHNARGYGIDSSLYPTLTSIEMACTHHPWFRGAAPE